MFNLCRWVLQSMQLLTQSKLSSRICKNHIPPGIQPTFRVMLMWFGTSTMVQLISQKILKNMIWQLYFYSIRKKELHYCFPSLYPGTSSALKLIEASAFLRTLGFHELLFSFNLFPLSAVPRIVDNDFLWTKQHLNKKLWSEARI